MAVADFLRELMLDFRASVALIDGVLGEQGVLVHAITRGCAHRLE